MRTLVTGGAGFIGSHLCDLLLASGHEVVAIDDLSTGALANLATARRDPRFSFEENDIRDPAIAAKIEAARPNVVFHLAAQASVAASVADPVADALTNVIGTLRVLEASRAARVGKVVFAASGGTLYGEVARDELPVAESHPEAPTSPYGISKRIGVEYLRAYARLFELDSVALALGNVYGPRQDPYGEAGVAAIFCANAIAGRPSTIDGDGNQTRDFVYVGDVARAFLRAAEKDAHGLFNIGTGLETSVNELYAAVMSALPASPGPRTGPARHGDIRHSALDSGRARALLGWEASTSLGDGLGHTLAALAAAVDPAPSPDR